MSRKLPPFIQGNYYHLYNRGAHKVSIFREEANYLFVLGKMRKYVQQFDLAVIAYCLMPNHYHLLLRQEGDIPAGKLPQGLFNSYSKAYNKRYQHSGTLFEGPYKPKHVDNEGYLRHLCRYIHANPLKDGLVRTIEEWPFSNYHEFVGARNGMLVDRDFVNAFFPDSEAYKAFVMDFLRERELPEALKYLRE